MTTTVSTALRRIADAMGALEPYEADAAVPMPYGLLGELADAVLSAPADAIAAIDATRPGEGEGLLDWARDYTERRDYPEFFALLAEIGRIRREQGEEAAAAPEHAELFMKMMHAAPPRYWGVAEAVAEDFLPTATHFTDDGQPVYSAQQVADKLGVPVDEVEAGIQRMEDEGLSDGPYTGPVHAIQ